MLMCRSKDKSGHKQGPKVNPARGAHMPHARFMTHVHEEHYLD
jgi:hypothetical protein